jgi:hypothetical protein
MTAALTTADPGSLSALDPETMNSLMSGGDCSRLTPAQKTAYYLARCDAAGLDPRAQPFAFMNLNGKTVLYAVKAAADQLSAKHGLKTSIVSQTTEDGIRVVTVHVDAKDGRSTEEIGALPVKGLAGEALSNALMKCVTKAKRRAVLSICGLGMLDETEVESIPGAAPGPVLRAVDAPPQQDEIRAPAVEAAKVVTKEPKKAANAKAIQIWSRLVDECGGDKKVAMGKFETASTTHFGVTTPPTSDWTDEDCAAVEKILFDVPF